MFNYFTNQRIQDIEKAKEINTAAEEKIKHFKKCTLNSILEKDKILMRKYIDRTTHSYERMIEVNEDMKEYKNYRHEFRDFNKSLNIGPPSFHFQARSDKDRLNEAEKENKTLDEIPFYGHENPAFHQFRDNKSEGNMKYTSFDSKSRVMETIKKMSTNEIPTSWNMNLKGYLSFHKSKIKSKSKEKDVSNVILPTLNIKHHPKTLSSIHNRLEVGALKDVLIENLKNKMEDNVEGGKIEKESMKNGKMVKIT